MKHIKEETLPVYRIKKLNFKNKPEKYKLFNNKEVIGVIDSETLTDAERLFMRSTDGFQFILNQIKNGVRDIALIQAAVYQHINNIVGESLKTSE